MASKNGKESLQAAEKRQEEATERYQRLKCELRSEEEQLLEMRSSLSRAQGELTGARARRLTSQQARDQLIEELKLMEDERSALSSELMELQASEKTEEIIFRDIKKARDDLSAAAAALEKVRNEIEALQSDRAVEAAVEACGGELPEDVVPPRVPEIHRGGEDVDRTRSSSPALADDGLQALVAALGEEYRIKLAPVLQSHLVVAALQRSLCVRAWELRENTKQLGFARSAAANIEQLSISFSCATQDALQQVAALREETECFLREAAVAKDNTDKWKLELEQLLQRRGPRGPSDMVQQVLEEIQTLRNRREQAAVQVAEMSVLREKLILDCGEAQRAVDAKQELLEVHPAESALRGGAAEKLALQAEEYARRAQAQLEQTRQEVASIEASRRELKERYEALLLQLEDQRRCRLELQDQHDCVNSEIMSLAQHYLAQVPSLVSLDGLAASGFVNLAETKSAS